MNVDAMKNYNPGRHEEDGHGHRYPEHEDKKECQCDKKAVQDVDVAVGVEIRPDVKFGKIEVECEGDPCVKCDHDHCSTGFTLVISQHIKVKVPIKFDINAVPGAMTVNCSDC